MKPEVKLQKEVFSLLANGGQVSSIEHYARAEQIIRRALLGQPISPPCREESEADSSLVIRWNEEIRAKFIDWMRENEKSEEYIQKCVNYLDKHMRPIRTPQDVLEMFKSCERGRQHLDRAFRNLLKLYEKILGYPKSFLDSLRSAIPRIKTGVDLHVPTDEEIEETFRKLRDAPAKYKALWLLVACGVRMEHAIELLNNWDRKKLQIAEGFCRYTLGLIRSSKACFFAYFPNELLPIIEEFLSGPRPHLSRRRIWQYAKNHGLVRPKYVRKWSYTKMIELGIPESVADFIHGRGPRTVGAQHYLEKARVAEQYIPKFIEHLRATLKRANW